MTEDDYILLTETPSRLNLTGFQPGLDGIPNVKFWTPKPKKGEVKAITFETIEFTGVEPILGI